MKVSFLAMWINKSTQKNSEIKNKIERNYY